MLATDMQPASIVEDKGFQKFVAALDSRYELPSRRTIMRSLLSDKYEETKNMVKSDLAAASHVALHDYGHLDLPTNTRIFYGDSSLHHNFMGDGFCSHGDVTPLM